MSALPLHVANHIARVCGLPGLFIGEHSGVRIEYIWAANYGNWRGYLSGTTVVVKSNLWRRGLIDYRSGGVTAFVELPEHDGFVPALKHIHQNGYQHRYGVLDGYGVSTSYLGVDGFFFESLSNPIAGYASLVQVEYEYMLDLERILLYSKQPAKVIAPATSRDDLLTEVRKPTVSYYNLMRVLARASRFGIHGLLEHDETRRVVDYFMKVNWYYRQYLFACISGDLYYVRHGSEWMSAVNPEYDKVFLWGWQNEDWPGLFLESRSDRYRTEEKFRRTTVELKLETYSVVMKSAFSIANPVKTPRIWHRLQPMIKSLETDAWIQKKLRR